MADVRNQLKQQSRLGVQTAVNNEVPEIGPVSRGLWFKIPQVTAVFADLKGSTKLNADYGPEVAAKAYTYFNRAATVVLDNFDAGYIDVQGDAVFGLFSGKGSIFLAAVSARAMLSAVQREVAPQFRKDTSSHWNLTVGIGMDHGTLLVRRLGLKGARENEVWGGNPVNMAAKLSSTAGPDQIAISERVFAQYANVSKLRQQAILQSCGCSSGTRGRGFDTPPTQRSSLWKREQVSHSMGLDFLNAYKMDSAWCETHGAEYCETVINGQR